jgi:site-specific recombinase XerD
MLERTRDRQEHSQHDVARIIGRRCGRSCRGHHRAALKDFRESNPRVLLVAQVNRRVAGEFVTGFLNKSGKAPRTRNRILSSLSSFWKWMIKRGLAESNPWQGQGDFSKRAKGTSSKRPFTADELLKLLHNDPVALMGERYGGAIRDLQRLGLMTDLIKRSD